MTTSQAAEHAELIPGRWHWVSKANGSWHPALHNPMSAGGWTNEDTWEDFDRAIIQWRLIPLPSAHDALSALAQPEPVGPTDEEIMELMPQQMHEDLAAAARALAEQASTVSRSATGVMRIMLNRHAVDLARAVLQRFGRPTITPISPDRVPLPQNEEQASGMVNVGLAWLKQHSSCRLRQPGVTPIPMSERLPGNGDLDDQGTCWMWHPVNFHYCLCRPDPSVHSYWLPHHALPLPSPNCPQQP
jgi:hypothetical protein